LLGRNLDPIIQYAPCDVAVVRATEEPNAFGQRLRDVKRVLVPSGGGPNASLAIQLALSLGEETRGTALRVSNANLGATAVSAQWQLLRASIPEDEERVEARVVLASGVVDGILREAEQGYDLLLLGATRESFIDRLIFGNLRNCWPAARRCRSSSCGATSLARRPFCAGCAGVCSTPCHSSAWTSASRSIARCGVMPASAPISWS
jgi:nucleotide-binding universal stress UspA family protein